VASDQVYGLAAGLLSAFVFGVAAVAQAHGVRRSGRSPDHLADFVRSSVRDGWTWLVLVAYLAGFVLHAVAIWLLPLYLAQATIAMSLPVTAFASRRLAERLGATEWTSIALISGGLVFLALGSGPAGDVVTTWTFAGAIWAGFLVLAGLSLLGGRLRGAGLGAVAGVGYAGSAIAVRGVTTPVDAQVVVAALAVPALSLIAFWLYSRGMHGDAVSATSAALIVGQTFVPALLGVAFLGDEVRDGWWWSILLGLVLSTLGAVRLTKAQAAG
jgi:drug/metabolite transporter (DMT)-like permease